MTKSIDQGRLKGRLRSLEGVMPGRMVQHVALHAAGFLIITFGFNVVWDWLVEHRQPLSDPGRLKMLGLGCFALGCVYGIVSWYGRRRHTDLAHK